ncbi:signal recognition particle 14 kDa protein-like [Lontra canadensis]|uniref:signal recognition particle 14 kDa protein-like n=1 Tax=Lontra canadensis TaxID=76717 RepID=UPI0013F2B933|nr:signal recognition particle 14 kDa protein-like [Lontra canadensis]
MALQENEQFLTQLTTLSKKCQLSGSVFITQKKYDGRTKPIPRKGSVEGFESLHKCLFRAPNGKEKISTMASSKEGNQSFRWRPTSNLPGVNTDGLKEGDRKNDSRKSKAAQGRAPDTLLSPTNHRITIFPMVFTVGPKARFLAPLQ